MEDRALFAALPALDRTPPPRPRAAGVLALGAILLFVATGGAVLSASLAGYLGGDGRVDPVLVIALLLNVALVLFCWRRHDDLRREVAIRAAIEARMQLLATRDPLTGFLNRRALAEEGGALLVHAQRRHKALALILLDLDHFKTVNDLHGHAMGDALLAEVARELAGCVPPTALLARTGGDEFACAFLFDAGHADPVARVAERLVARMAQPFAVQGHVLQLGASIGITRSDADAMHVDGLLRTADIALYAAKAAGRNRFAWFDASMERELRERDTVERALRLGLPRGEIVPYFERQVDLLTGRLAGFEVLARWEHPTRGLLAPDQFLDVATEAGLIAEISMTVLRHALMQARDWDAGLCLSVNLAPWQLRDPWFAQKLIKLLTECGFPAARLEVEITEAALIDNVALAQTTAISLKNQSIGIVLDNFGTGYSSIAHLRALPFDRIKLDRSFVTAMRADAESAAVVTAIAGLADSLNLPLAAQGIEDEATEARLRALGCRRGQGFFYGRAGHAAATRSLLAERHLIAAAPESERLAS